MVAPLSDYIAECEKARLFSKGRFAADGAYLRSASLRIQHIWAQALQHVDAIREMFRDADRRRRDAEFTAAAVRAKEPTPAFTKALRGLDAMYAALPKRLKAVAHPVVEEQKPRAGGMVAKCFDALAHNPNLNAAQRCELMLGLSRAANLFSKSHQANIARITRALALLHEARARKLGDVDADTLITSLEESVRRGEVEPSEIGALEIKLNDIRQKLQEHLHGKK